MFVKQAPIGIDISDYSIEVMQLNNDGQLRTYGRILLEKGIVNDGRIVKPEQLAAKLKQVLHITKPIPLLKRGQAKAGLKAVASLPESKTYIHTFDVDSQQVTAKLIKEIDTEVAAVVPFDVNSMQKDYLEINQPDKALLFVGTSKDLVGNYTNVFAAAGIELVALDIESSSLGRALLPQDTRRLPAAILDIGARTTSLSIFDNKKNLNYSVSIPIAGNHFTRAIAEGLKVDWQKAEALKRQHGLNPDSRVSSIIQRNLSQIVEECRQAINYHEQKNGQKIQEIILAGGSALVPKIDEYFSKNLGTRVSVGKSPVFANVTGLAMRAAGKNPEQGINLLGNASLVLAVGSKIMNLVANKKAVSLAVILLLITLGGAGSFVYFGNRSNPIIIQAQEINIYAGPGKRFSIKGQFDPNQTYPRLAEYNNWVKIKLRNQVEGWVEKQYLNYE